MTTFANCPQKNDLLSFSYLMQVVKIGKTGGSYSTVFFMEYNTVLYLVTARHNIYSISDRNVLSTKQGAISLRQHGCIQLRFDHLQIIQNPEYDLVLIKLDRDLIPKNSINIINVNPIADNASLINKNTSVFLIGFPHTKGITNNALPTVTNGVLISDMMSNGKPNLGVGMTALSEPGASGSPVYGYINDTTVDLLGIYHGEGVNDWKGYGVFTNRWMIYWLLRESNNL